MKLTITFVGRYTTKKDGSPLIGANGKPYTSLRLKANEYGDKFLSGFDNAQTRGWKVGDTVEVDVEQKGEYLNFSVPQKPAGGAIELDMLRREISTNTTVLKQILAVAEDIKMSLSTHKTIESLKKVDITPVSEIDFDVPPDFYEARETEGPEEY